MESIKVDITGHRGTKRRRVTTVIKDIKKVIKVTLIKISTKDTTALMRVNPRVESKEDRTTEENRMVKY